MSVSLDTLNPYVKFLAQKFLDECKIQKFPVKIIFTFRSIQEQNALYAKGRTTRGPKVTNARGGYSYHNYGLAFDVAPLVNGKIDWNDINLYKRMGEIGMSVGLEWGGNWKSFKDMPHFQWTGDLNIKQLLSGKRPVAPSDFSNNTQENKVPEVDYVRLLKVDSIKVFQAKMGLDDDGIVGPKTKSVINSILEMPTIKEGSKDVVVRYLQLRLNIDIDGIFGPKTEESLKNWQKVNNLDVNGICGKKDWDVLI